MAGSPRVFVYHQGSSGAPQGKEVHAERATNVSNAILDSGREQLIALNDHQLEALIRADGTALERAVEQLLIEAEPIVDAILSRYARSRGVLSREDAEDVRATIHLRLMLKLRQVATTPEEAVQNLRGYVARLTYNAVSDHLRTRFPERALLKRRLRYTLTHDRELAFWSAAIGPVCGRAAWRGREDAIEQIPQQAIEAVRTIERGDASSALDHLFRESPRPALFESVVDAVAEAWGLVDLPPAPLEDLAAPSDATDRAEEIAFVRALWSEIRELRPMQRKALLLNLRYSGETNIVSLIVLAGIATFDEIAAVLEMSRSELMAVWRALPMEDAKIAERFGITRQQVINLRKAARDRLSRRLRR